jgi:hypothetical protein
MFSVHIVAHPKHQVISRATMSEEKHHNHLQHLEHHTILVRVAWCKPACVFGKNNGQRSKAPRRTVYI